MKKFFVLLSLFILWGCHKKAVDAYYMAGDPSRGGKLFSSKGCMTCHAINGIGGTEAADLGQPAKHLMTAYGVITSMWNHGPDMRQKIKELNMEFPHLSLQETEDILAFLFNATYFNDLGSYEKGKEVIIRKNCLTCHSTSPDEKNTIISFGKYLHPIVWIQKMWNHAPVMRKAIEAKKMEWPKFTGNEMADLLTYLNAKSPLIKDVEGIFPADPGKGKQMYEKTGCGACHGKTASDLFQPSESTRTMVTLAAAMWNHYPEMEKAASGQHPFPTFKRKEMADLIAYIFTTRYFWLKGDAKKGEIVFRDKKCADCHLDSGGPPLQYFKGKCTPAFMIAQMWNHGALMEEKIKEKGWKWPLLKEPEMVDLMSYLNEGTK